MRRAYVMNLLKQVSGRLASVAALSAGVLLVSLPAHAGCDAEVRRCWAPAVTINAPGAGSTFSAPGLVNFSVYAEDVNAGQPITKVELYQNGALVGTSTSGGTNYSFSVSGLAVGSYSFQVKAYDRNYTIAVGGLKSPAGSASVSITVNNPSPSPTIWVNRTRPMIVGQAATLNWGSTNATSVSYNCTSSGGGFAGTGTVATSGGNSGPPDPAWVGHPSTCVWTATGPGGSASTTETLETINPPPAPTISVSRNPSPLVAGSSYSLNWSTTDATSVNLSCTASGSGFVTSGGLETNGNRSGVASSAWVGYPSTCTWTATGPGGSKSVTETMTTVLPPAPTISISRTTMEAGENSTLYWASTNADSVSYSCTANGTGFKGSGTMPTVNGNQTSVSSADWVGYPSTCIWTATGPGGSKSYTETVVTNPSSNTPPTASLKASPTNVRIATGGTANIVFTGNSADSNGQVVKLELFRDNGSGYSATPVTTTTGSAATLAFNYTYPAAAGSYRFKLRATDNKGAYTDSAPIVINVTDSPLLGGVNGVRFNTADKPELIGWVCQANTATPLNIQLFANAPASLGGTLIGSGTAGLSEEADNIGIQNACGTPGVGHRFRLDLSPYTSQYAGVPIYVIGLAATGTSNIVLPCDDNTCTMPGGMRIGLTTPANNDRYTAPANVFGRFKLFNATGPYDEVSVFFDSEWVPASADTAANTFYASKVNLPARAAPYRIQAKVRQGNTTLYSPESLIYVDSGAGSGSLTLTSSSTTYQAPANIDLVATLGATTYGVTSVKFSQGGVDIGSGTLSNGAWRYTWSGVAVGAYSLVAKAFDSGGALVATSSTLALTVGTSTGTGTTLANLVTPYLDMPDAGTLLGDMDVSSNGAATYAIPLAMPPGTAGMVPAISLSYSSQGGNGLLGVGGSLNGFSAINRCSQIIAIDGAAGAVRFNNADRLCLDGQHLILVNLPMSDANYWSDSAEYRTELEGFSRVTAQVSNGKRSFKVQTKSGQILLYGDSPDSYVEAQGRVDGQARRWALHHVEDRVGNAIDYEYNENGATGEHTPKVVRWGANTNANQSHYGKVEFAYGSDADPNADRPDADVGYLAGSHVDLRKRLRQVTTYTDTQADGSGGILALQYKLGYDQSPSSTRSRLTSVQTCDSNSKCLTATTFSWGNAASVNYSSVGRWNGPTIPLKRNQAELDPKILGAISVVDLNGDGMSDLIAADAVYLSTGSEWSGFNRLPYPEGLPATSTLDQGRPSFGDFDGDGRPELLWLRVEQPPSSPKTYFVTRCRVDGIASSAVFNCDPEISLGETKTVSDFIADVDGDGKSEILIEDNGGQRCAFVGQSIVCKPWRNVSDVKSRWERIDGGENGIVTAQMLKQGGDFDGDGIGDFLFSDGTLCLTARDGFDCRLLASFKGAFGELTPASQGSFFGDMNGDGLTDYPYFNRDADPGFEQGICYGTGNGLDCKPVANLSSTGMPNGFSTGRILSIGNVNGDGTSNWMFGVGGCVVIDGRANCKEGSAPTGWNGPQGPSLPNTYMLGDFTGRGQVDIATYRGGADAHWELYSADNLAGADRVISVKNGAGHETDVTYALAKNAHSVTAPEAFSYSYPLRPVTNPGQLVSVLRVGNGASEGYAEHNFRYVGAAMDMSGRGSVGMAHRYVSMSEIAMSPNDWYRQDWPYVGMVSRHVVYSWDSTLEDTNNTLNEKVILHPNGQKTSFAYVDSSTTKREVMGLTGTSVTTNQYDNYGNPTRINVVSVGENDDREFVTTTSNEYLNDATTWRLGELRQVNLTKTSPSDQQTRTTAFDYYGNGLLKSETTEPGNPALQITTVYERNNLAGLVTKRSQYWLDPESNSNKSRSIDETSYDNRNRFALQLKNALNQTETRTFDNKTGGRTSLSGPNGLVTYWDLDGFGQVVKERRADGTEVRFYSKRCVSGCVLEGSSQVSISEMYKGSERVAVPLLTYQDRLGHSVGTQSWSFDGRVVYTQNFFDEKGLLYRTDQPRFKDDVGVPAIVYGFDHLNRVTSTTTYDEDGNGSTSYIGPGGLQTTTQNARGQYKVEYRNITGQLEKVEENGWEHVTLFERDAFGNLTKTTDPLRNTVKIAYDGLGRKIKLDDPDLGITTYDVNPLGQVWRQVSPKQRAGGQSTRMVYDDLGRMVARFEPDLESHWVYDQSSGGCAATKSCGQLVEAYTGTPSQKDYIRQQNYDELGRLQTTTIKLGTSVDGTFTSTTVYDDKGRLKQQQHQRVGSQAKVFDYLYNNIGYQYRIERNGVSLWESKVQDAANRVNQSVLGNGLVVDRVYNTHSGRLTDGVLRTNLGELRLQETYQYDVVGNVLLRGQYWGTNGFTESFDYDQMNRLSYSEVLGQTRQEFKYNDIGNIISKTGVGQGDYVYPESGSARPHAVISIPGIGGFSYDDNGNMINGAGRSTCWTSFDMPRRINKGAACDDMAGVWSSFNYGPEHQRTVQTKSDGSVIRYAGAMEVETKNGNSSVKTYWPAGLGVEIDVPGQATKLNWTHTDRLGSVVGITDESGALVERLAYDAWGKRRSLDGSATPDSIDGQIDNKGFTGHEMLDQLDLVHMNGRVYDPLITRFISADPLIQDPEHSQSYNRYTYVWNNPTNLTDPSGFSAIGGTEWSNVLLAAMNTIMSDTATNFDGRGQGFNDRPDPEIGAGCGITRECIYITGHRLDPDSADIGLLGSIFSSGKNIRSNGKGGPSAVGFFKGVVAKTTQFFAVPDYSKMSAAERLKLCIGGAPAACSYGPSKMKTKLKTVLGIGMSAGLGPGRGAVYVYDSVQVARVAGLAAREAAVREAEAAAIAEARAATVTARDAAKAEMFADKTAKELADIYGWGRGAEGVSSARASLDNAAMERIQAGVTRAEVEAAERMYTNAANLERGGGVDGVAGQRAEYMKEILERWK